MFARLIERLPPALRGVQMAYAVTSAAACTVDFAITVTLAYSGWAAPLAAAYGYLTGSAVHWALSTRFVFAAQTATDGTARRKQAALFFASGLVGLVVTVAVFSAGMAFGLGAAFAKIIAVGVSFVIVYLARRHFVFREAAAP